MKRLLSVISREKAFMPRLIIEYKMYFLRIVMPIVP